MTGTAFRLAWKDTEGLRTSPYGYFQPRAAQLAAPLLNRTRSARGQQAYTHVVEFSGGDPIGVRTLETS
jgi:hypothetical protein